MDLPVSAIIDTGGPITLVSRSFASLLDAMPSGERIVMTFAGGRHDCELVNATLVLVPPPTVAGGTRSWTGLVAVVDRWPHSDAEVIFGQHGFLDSLTITFGEAGFVIEDASVFADRFGAQGMKSG